MPTKVPKPPGLVIEKVPRWISSGSSFLVRARSARSLIAAGDAEQRQLVGVPDDGDDQAPVQRHGDAEIDVAAEDGALTHHGGVEHRVLRGGCRPLPSR